MRCVRRLDTTFANSSINGQYWVMGLWYPLGFALLHASNTRFLHVAKQQRRFAQGESYTRQCSRSGLLGGMSYTKKIMVTVGIGMSIQVRLRNPQKHWYSVNDDEKLLLVVAMYLLSRKFHPSFGIPGTEVLGNPWEVNQKQKIGWEWWVPSYPNKARHAFPAS